MTLNSLAAKLAPAVAQCIEIRKTQAAADRQKLLEEKAAAKARAPRTDQTRRQRLHVEQKD
jgi:hypothetical protein